MEAKGGMTAERWCECADVPEMLLKFVHLIVEGCGDVSVWSVGQRHWLFYVHVIKRLFGAKK